MAVQRIGSPMGIPPSLNRGSAPALYGLNCSIADTMREAHLPPGSVKRVRFVEASQVSCCFRQERTPLAISVPLADRGGPRRGRWVRVQRGSAGGHAAPASDAR